MSPRQSPGIRSLGRKALVAGSGLLILSLIAGCPTDAGADELASAAAAAQAAPASAATVAPPPPPPLPTPPAQPVTLYDQEVQLDDVAQIPVAIGGCGTAAFGFIDTFRPSTVGKEVTITVAGPASNSRPQILVVDQKGNALARSDFIGRTATARFTPTSNADVIFAVDECQGGIISGSYDVKVVQAP